MSHPSIDAWARRVIGVLGEELDRADPTPLLGLWHGPAVELVGKLDLELAPRRQRRRAAAMLIGAIEAGRLAAGVEVVVAAGDTTLAVAKLCARVRMPLIVVVVPGTDRTARHRLAAEGATVVDARPGEDPRAVAAEFRGPRRCVLADPQEPIADDRHASLPAELRAQLGSEAATVRWLVAGSHRLAAAAHRDAAEHGSSLRICRVDRASRSAFPGESASAQDADAAHLVVQASDAALAAAASWVGGRVGRPVSVESAASVWGAVTLAWELARGAVELPVPERPATLVVAVLSPVEPVGDDEDHDPWWYGGPGIEPAGHEAWLRAFASTDGTTQEPPR